MGSSKKNSAVKQANEKRRSSIAILEKKLDDPPPYTSQPPSANTSFAEVKATDSASNPTLGPDKLDFTPSALELPTPAECLAHLKLLHAFAKLRHLVGNSNGYCGIQSEETKFEGAKENGSPEQNSTTHKEDNYPESDGVSGQRHNSASDVRAERIRERRWLVYVTKAVDRFNKWLDTEPLSSIKFPNSVKTYHFEFGWMYAPDTFPQQGDGLKSIVLPPLDVLMVWHAYMLNPRVYLEDSMRQARHKLWHTPLPWEMIYNMIDDKTFEYRADLGDIQSFQTKTKLKWYTDNTQKRFNCPKCKTSINVPWTEPPLDPTPQKMDEYLSNDRGFVGHAFQVNCPDCHLSINHETLRVAKFIEDAESVTINSVPLPGTILNSLGLPQASTLGKHVSTHDPFFPNRAIRELAELKPNAMREELDDLTIDKLKTRFENVMNDSSKVNQINSKQYKSGTVFKESKIAVRKMFSHYWDNSSPFGLDLVGAVMRQGGFVQKMRRIDWLHSPAAFSTMQRLIIKYHRFIRIIADNRKQVAVPTLDVDLAWHTHQLSPSVYFRYTLAETKKFLNHDDKIPENSLNTAFHWTTRAYEKKYNTNYSECACWYCECTREPLRSSFTNRIIAPLRSSDPPYEIDAVEKKGLAKDPTAGVHVSSHNAVAITGKGGSPESWAQQRRRELEVLDLQYAKVCKRYQKKKKEENAPERANDAYIYGAYGYPLYFPVYVPYYAEPTCEGDRYSSAGGGGVGGACGSCAAGTCAGSASLGSCAGGAGTPGCKSSCGGHGDAEGGCGTCGDGGGGCGGCGG